MTTWVARFDELHQRAAQQAGLSDFGDTAYHEGFRQLLASLDDSARSGSPNPAAEGIILQMLGNRLHTQAQWKANPAYREREIPAPLVVIGVPRTGTTALFNLLSCDPQFQGIEKWLSLTPLVRPPRETWEANPLYQDCVRATEQMFAAAPEVMEAHGILADDVDECIVPMAQSFISNMFGSQLDIPGYDRWLMSADETPAFLRYKDILRLVGMNDDRRWLMKNPSHVFGINGLLAVFPDACVIQTHRDPTAALASLVNLMDNIVRSYTGVGINRDRSLSREIAFWGEGVRRSMAAQDQHPDRFVNVLQRDIRKDPLGVVQSIYTKFGLTLSAEAEAAMTEWAGQNSARGKEGGHRIESDAHQQAIAEQFGTYIARYGL